MAEEQSMTCAGVGLGFRPELAADLLGGRLQADFLEVVAESCLQSVTRREVAALSRMWPIALHGVKLSLGSVDGFELARARRFAAIAREVKAAVVTEHISFVRAGGCEIGHLTTLPWNDAAVETVARNARTLQALVDVPLLLENVAWTFRWPDDAMPEGEFLARVLDASGCDMLLDVGNLYANARNAGLDPLALLDAMPLERVRMLHVAGGLEEDGFYFDTHSHPVPDEVFTLVAAVRARIGDVPVLLERDGDLDDVAGIGGELARMRQGRPASGRMSSECRRGSDSTIAGGGAGSNTALAAGQAHLARLLTSGAEDVGPFDAAAIARSRAVLHRKRVDDALPILPELGRQRPRVEPLALAALAETPRAARFSAFSDAWSIAQAALGEEALRAAARADLLTLQARFVRRPDGFRPRLGPYVGRAREQCGTIWVTKGFGAEATVRMWRTRAK